MTISIQRLTKDNAPLLDGLITDMRLDKDSAYVDRCVDKSVSKERITLCAFHDTIIAGFCILNFRPVYAPFKKFSIPEIQDLNTHPDFRRKGVGRSLIEECEVLAKEQGAQDIGLGVGLHAGYGNAHRLYVKMGFIPDGQGVVYDAEGVQPNDIRPVDDELCLMMVKSL